MNVRLQYTLSFTAGVHYGDQLIMNNYLLRVYMITNTMEAENNNIAFERLKYFISEKMDSTIFINGDNHTACQLYSNAGINITNLPNEPVDQIVGVMLFHKLNAIMEDRISVVETELSSSLGDHMVYIHSENEITNEIVIPTWWTTPDLIHCDLELEKSDKVLDMHHTGVWRELDLSWPNEVVTETGNIVFADFSKDDTKQ